MTDLAQQELQSRVATEREALAAEFHIWLQTRFEGTEEFYINTLVSKMSTEEFYELAESWATDTKRNKVFY